MVEFVNELPAYRDDLTSSTAFQDIVSSGAQESVRAAQKDLATGARAQQPNDAGGPVLEDATRAVSASLLGNVASSLVANGGRGLSARAFEG